MSVRVLCGLLLCVMTAAVPAEVTDVSASGFTSQHQLILAVPPAEAYQALTGSVSEWWDAVHSFGGDAAAFSIDARAGGCFCEALAGGGTVEHMRVVRVVPGKVLVMRGGLGPLQQMGVTGAMTFSFEPHAEGSVLTYRYVVGGYVAGGLEGMAGPVDQVQLGQLKRLQNFVGTGAPER